MMVVVDLLDFLWVVRRVEVSEQERKGEEEGDGRPTLLADAPWARTMELYSR